MSTQKIYDSVVRELKRNSKFLEKKEVRHLDVGVGKGTLVADLQKNFPQIKSWGCDFHTDRFKGVAEELKQVNLDKLPLPYADASFDLVTCTEVLEHVENYRAVVRDIQRVLKPGGVLILTTPNVLNTLSRWRNLSCGFANLFGPIPVKRDNFYSTGQHITPIPYFYMAHALLDADFTRVDLALDKVNVTSAFLLIPLLPLLLLTIPGFYFKEKFKFKTFTPENTLHVYRHFSLRLLLGRTIVVTAFKS